MHMFVECRINIELIYGKTYVQEIELPIPDHRDDNVNNEYIL